MLLYFFGECIACALLIFRSQYNGGLYHHTANVIRNSRDSAFHHSRVSHHGTFHFEWSDAIARTLDDVISATHKPAITFFIAISNVARMVKPIVQNLTGHRLIAIVTTEKSQRVMPILRHSYDDFSLFTNLCRRTVRANDVEVVNWIGNAHRTRTRFYPGEGDNERSCLGLPKSFCHFQSSAFLEGFKH